MSLLGRLIGHREPPSRQVARDRLQLVLVHDRIRLPAAEMAALKDELVAVLSRYFCIDTDGIEITFTQSRRMNRLIAEVPLVGSAQAQER
jgi:cell division topological specificity factor